MIEKKIPRDIEKYESKLIGPFTTRQIVCLVPGIALAIGVFFLLRNSLGDLALFLSLLVATPFALCGFWKPYGMPFEKFAFNVLVPSFLNPAKRKYQREDRYAGLFEETVTDTPKPPKQKQSKNSQYQKFL